MTADDTLSEFRGAYIEAGDDRFRLAAIHRLRAAQPRLSVAPDHPALAPVLDALLHFSRCDSLDGRFAAVRLLRDLWCGLCPAPPDALFCGFTLRLLDSLPSLRREERRVIWKSIERGFETATPSSAASLCRTLIGREVARCLRALPSPDVWSGLPEPAAPNLDVMRLVVMYAPSGAWSSLARDLWRLYNRDMGVAETLARASSALGSAANTTLSGLTFGPVPPGAPSYCRVAVRRGFDGERTYTASCWEEISRWMLARTLEEARPEDLGDAAPSLFAWLEALAEARLPEHELESLLSPLVAWETLPAVPVLERWSHGPYGREFRRRAAVAAAELRAALGVPEPADALIEFRESFLAARGDGQRLAAIRLLRAALPELPVHIEPDTLEPVLDALLRHALRDGPDARFATARLLRDLWRRLHRETLDPLFSRFTERMLESLPDHDLDVRITLRDAVAAGIEIAGPSYVEAFCRDVTAREVARCLTARARSRGRLGLPPAPNFDALRLVVKYAPTGIWPELVRDLWSLYNLDLNVAEKLARTANLSVSRAKSRAEVRRASNGKQERVEICWDIARRLARRTLEEARPDDLGDAAPGFFAWLESLTGVAEQEAGALIPSLVAWAVPPAIPVLECWSKSAHGEELRWKASRAAVALRAALGITPELVPAPPAHGTGHEVAPT
jgi:hypothetical protein